MSNNKVVYPIDFNDEQKEQYDLLLRQAKVLFPESEEWALSLAIIAYIRQGSNNRPVISPEEIQEYKDRYNINTEFITEVDESLLEQTEDACKWIETKTSNNYNILDNNIIDNKIKFSNIIIEPNENIQNK